MKNPVELFEQIWGRYETLDGRGRVGLGASVALVLCVAVVVLPGRIQSPAQTVQQGVVPKHPEENEESGYFLNEDIDQKAYVQRLESQYFSVEQKNQVLASRLEDMGQKMNDIMNAQAKFSEALAAFDRRVNDAAVKERAATMAGRADAKEGPAADVRNYQLEVININPVKARSQKTVYLPVGSFVRATLLTGVYAPAESANPLPVLIRLNEAFYGPNQARIPLQGAFAVGKAAGDLNSERALVQITTLSSVLPDARTFEHKGNIGYLTDELGQLGLKGVVVRNTGGQLAMSFMTGFTGGASQALADAQTTTVSGDNGHVSRNVTGSRSKNAGFQGLAQSAAQMSKYYEDQLSRIVPAVKVDAGADVYLIVLEGVQVHGLEKSDLAAVRFID